MSLYASETETETGRRKVTHMPPRRGWGMLLLPICRPAGARESSLHLLAINVSPRWGWEIFFVSAGYKHVAPMGLGKSVDMSSLPICRAYGAGNWWADVVSTDLPPVYRAYGAGE